MKHVVILPSTAVGTKGELYGYYNSEKMYKNIRKDFSLKKPEAICEMQIDMRIYQTAKIQYFRFLRWFLG